MEAAGDTVVLSGEVSGPTVQETALALATPYAGGKKEKVVNLLHVGGVQQVMVAVRVAEINRSVGKEIGINFAWSGAGGSSIGATLLNKLTSLTSIRAKWANRRGKFSNVHPESQHRHQRFCGRRFLRLSLGRFF